MGERVVFRVARGLPCAILSLGLACAAAAQDIRLVEPLNLGWRFSQASGSSGVQAPTFNDASWSSVDLPHTWNRIGNEGTERSPLSNSVQGVGWYRLRFKPPRGTPESRYFLQFDAVGAVAEVWLNGRYLGGHAGAFSGFRFDATPSSILPATTFWW
jgi:beta-galactosidase